MKLDWRWLKLIRIEIRSWTGMKNCFSLLASNSRKKKGSRIYGFLGFDPNSRSFIDELATKKNLIKKETDQLPMCFRYHLIWNRSTQPVFCVRTFSSNSSKSLQNTWTQAFKPKSSDQSSNVETRTQGHLVLEHRNDRYKLSMYVERKIKWKSVDDRAAEEGDEVRGHERWWRTSKEDERSQSSLASHGLQYPSPWDY